MPEFRDDPRARQVYEFEHPGVDLSRDKSKVKLPYLVESVGTDGRFLGGIRFFPGMADLTVHGVKNAGSGNTTNGRGTAVSWTIANVILAKYASIQKGLSEDVLRGIAFLADNQAGSNKSLYFSYVDSSDGTSNLVELEDFSTIPEATQRPVTWLDYDIGFSKRYIYLVASCTFSSTTYPLNRAYWWDFKHNTWETPTTGFQRRTAGIFYHDKTYKSEEDIYPGSGGAEGRVGDVAIGNSFTGRAQMGVFTFGIRARSRKHNLRSRIALRPYANTSGATDRKLIIGVRHLDSPQTTGVFDPTLAYTDSTDWWGLHHIDALEVYTTVSSPQVAAATLPGNIQYLADLHKVLPDAEKSALSGATASVAVFSVESEALGSNQYTTSPLTDLAVAGVLDRYDPFLDTVGEMPRASRCLWWDNTGLLVTDIIAKASPELRWYETNSIADTLRWSSLTSGEPENFPVNNVYRPEDPAEKFQALIPTGDYVFATTNNGVYRCMRNGSAFSVVLLNHKMSIPSRYAATGVGSSLFVVTTSGVKEIDGNTGGVQSLSQLDRMIFDTLQWGASLSSVQIAYDAVAGALILLNTSTDQAVILWEATGAVTRLEDMPFAFMTEGLNPKTGTGHRVYFIMDDFRTFVIDTQRAMSSYNLCAGGAGEDVNAVVTSGSTSTVINFGGQVVPANCKGFKIHVLTGARAGESSTITVRNSATQITVSPALTGAPSALDVVAIAPVVFRIQCPQYTGNGIATDTFLSKTLKFVGLSLTNINRGSGQNIQVGAFLRDTKLTGFDVTVDDNPDNMVKYIQSASSSAVGTQLYPYVECKRADMDFEVQALKAEGVITGTEQEVRQS